MSNRHSNSNRLTYTAETPKFLRGLVNSLPNARNTLPSTLLGHISDPNDNTGNDNNKKLNRVGNEEEQETEEPTGLAGEWDGPEEERPQIVVLRKGKHLSEEAVERELGITKEGTNKRSRNSATATEDDNNKSDEDNDDKRGEAVAEDGRLLFRPPKKTKSTSANKFNAEGNKKSKKQRKSQKTSSKLLSFDTEDA
ncbi:hypothetical protein BDF19DRAFT_430051 [Syncephalis fuscata]|nr:hypothetical protein BDF19DRAFT_430051 [Syncephalis fuscata]